MPAPEGRRPSAAARWNLAIHRRFKSVELGRLMQWKPTLGVIALIGLAAGPIAANASTRTYSYTISHPLYGAIGTYSRTIDDAGGDTRAVSRLRVAVKVLGIVAHRENADQTEVWRGRRLASFSSATTVNGRLLSVSGEARGDRFMVTTPLGTVAAPADVAASDPWSLNRMGPGVVVSIKSGRIDKVDVTGGETERVVLPRGPTTAQHFHIATAAQQNKWEVWIDNQGVPVKFRSSESSGTVEFTLVSPAPQAADRLALQGSQTVAGGR
jgi:hypothetical protein